MSRLYILRHTCRKSQILLENKTCCFGKRRQLWENLKVRTTKFDKKIFQMNAKLFSQNLTIVNQSRYFFIQLSYLQNRNGISGPIEIIVYTYRENVWLFLLLLSLAVLFDKFVLLLFLYYSNFMGSGSWLTL